jgi:hypothetical protein
VIEFNDEIIFEMKDVFGKISFIGDYHANSCRWSIDNKQAFSIGLND